MTDDDPDLTLRMPTPQPDKPRTGSTSNRSKGWQPPTVEELQLRLPSYQINSLLGRGGMGAVYLGAQTHLDRAVAIKIMPPIEDDDQEGMDFSARFKNEAKAMAKLNHPGIVKVFDFGETADGLLYIVMEFIEGTDVAQMLKQQERLPAEHALAITAHVCDALQYAHARGIVHRDIKPANVMVGYDGVVKVADFGLAKMHRAGESGLTRSGMALGTLHYMAPEALMLGSSVDGRADVYAMGVMLYQMLTGRLPQGIFKMPSQIVPGLDPRYDGIVAKALREDRELRQQSAAELRADLDGILSRPIAKVEAEAKRAPAALPAQTRPHRPAGQPFHAPESRLPRQPPRTSATTVLAWVTLIALCAASMYFWQLPRPEPSLETTRVDEKATTAGSGAMATTPQPTIPKTTPARPIPPKDIIGRFTFDGTTPDPGARITNAVQQNGVLELTGLYEFGKPPGYRVTFATPSLDYSRFTVAARLRPERLNDVLLVGGTGYRWLSVRWIATNRLIFSMNNQRFNHTITGVNFQTMQWITLAVSCDLTAKQAVVYLDGKSLARIPLPDDFKLEVIGSKAEQSDKVWTTTNYSNGGAFRGLLDELVVYGRILTDQEIASLRLGENTVVPEKALAVESITPSSSTILKLGEKMTVGISYNNTFADGVQIFARPYTGGKMSPGYGAHTSAVYPRGKGKLEGWFSLQQPGAVDEVRVEMLNTRSKQVVAIASYFMKATWSNTGALTPAARSSPPAPNIKLGQELPIKFKAVDGRDVDLAALKGKVVLIDFWATWCGPCVVEIPKVISTYQKYHDKGFEIIGISFDSDKAALERMTKERGMTWPQYFDGKTWQNTFGTQFGIRAVPTMWLISKQGKVASLNARADLAAQVERLLGE
jgi:serine/threonine protein kinase/thiol-disulfide isomerase/thioredoxin